MAKTKTAMAMPEGRLTGVEHALEEAGWSIKENERARSAEWARLVRQMAEAEIADPAQVATIAKTPADLARLAADVTRARRLIAASAVARELHEREVRARVLTEQLTAEQGDHERALADLKADGARRLAAATDKVADAQNLVIVARRALCELVDAAPTSVAERWHALPGEIIQATNRIPPAERLLELAARPIAEQIGWREAKLEKARAASARYAGAHNQYAEQVELELAPLKAEVERIKRSSTDKERATAQAALDVAHADVAKLKAEQAELFRQLVGAA